jgi:hypothetical protein
MKVYLLWTRHMLHQAVADVLNGVFATRELAEHAKSLLPGVANAVVKSTVQEVEVVQEEVSPCEP